MVMRSISVAALALLLARPALAGRPDARVTEARQACAAGDVERGVQLLAEIVAERNDPNAIYNQARCYQANDQPEPALARFREYLRVAPRLSVRERRQVQDYMRELEQWLDARARRAALAAAAAAPDVTALPTAAAAASDSPTPPIVNLTRTKPEPAPAANRPLLVLSAVSAAAGVTALAGGVFYSLETRRLERQIERQALPIPGELYQRRTREGQRAQSRQWIGYGVGAAALGASAVLYLLGHGRF
jgi:hypothetical protein